MNNRIPDGAIIDIEGIAEGMMVKVKGDPVLHRCRLNDVYCDDGDYDAWGMALEHVPAMEYYNVDKRGYEDSASYDYAHVDSIEYALPPIPPQYIAIATKHGEIKLIEVSE